MQNPKQSYQNSITKQQINNKQYHYTLLKKQGSISKSTALGFGKNVFLIYNQHDNLLFYISSNNKPPFKDQNIFNQHKDVVSINKAHIQYKDKQISVEYQLDADQNHDKHTWIFQINNANLTKQWAQMLNSHKQEQPYEQLPQPSKILIQQQSQIKPNPKPSNPKPSNNNLQITKQVVEIDIQPKSKNQKRNGYSSKKNPVNQNSQVYQYNQPPNNQSNISRKPSSKKIPPNKPNTLPQQDEDQNRLYLAHQIRQSKRLSQIQSSQLRQQNQQALSHDWNYRFLQYPTRQTVVQFQKASLNAFLHLFQQNKGQSIFPTKVDGLNIQIVQNFTKQSKKLKNQYRNYHYIIQKCKQQPIINVPLSCLIQHLGYICLIKATFPSQTQIIKNKKDVEIAICQLQHKTKIANTVLFNNQCLFYDLTQVYGPQSQTRIIYVDKLYEYLPKLNIKQKQQQTVDQTIGFPVRPQLMSYLTQRVTGVSQIIQDQKTNKYKSQIGRSLQNQIQQIVQCLSSQDVYITNIFDLKQFLHYRGINMKLLFKIYQQINNKFVKKYLQTCIIAKLIKDQINFGLSNISKQTSHLTPQQYVQQQIRLYIEGKTSATNQCWKKLSTQYRNTYGIPINTHQLLGGFLLSSLMTLISADYSLKSLNKQKIIFKDQGIIKKGFVTHLKPKIKSFYRFDDKIVSVTEICKYSQSKSNVYQTLIKYLKLTKDSKIPQQYDINKGKNYVLGYLSDFIKLSQNEQNAAHTQNMGQSCVQHEYFQCSRQIQQLINFQPPNTPTIKMTLNFIKSLLCQKATRDQKAKKEQKTSRDQSTYKEQKYKTDSQRQEGSKTKNDKNKADYQLELIMSTAVEIITYWLQPEHPIICSFYQHFAFYEQSRGNMQESLNILQKIVQITYKTESKLELSKNKKIGHRHFILGNQYLKAGMKKQALQNLQKAKIFMEKSGCQDNQYTHTLFQLASLHLNNGDTDTCINLAKAALKNSQQGNNHNNYRDIKIFQVLCRAYEIKGQKQSLRKLGIQCAKQFNSTPQKSIYNEMVKICLTGAIAKLTHERSKSLLTLSQKIQQQYGYIPQNESLQKLMQKSKSVVIMQIFIIKCDLIQKILGQHNANKVQSSQFKQFIITVGLVVGCVGKDFIEGLHSQKDLQ